MSHGPSFFPVRLADTNRDKHGALIGYVGRKRSARAAGSSTLNSSCRRRTGNPSTRARWVGAKSTTRMRSPLPFTSHRPPKPCTPRLSGAWSSRDVRATALRAKRALKAQPIRTDTASSATSTKESEGRRNNADDSTRYQASKRIGKRDAPGVATSEVYTSTGRAQSGTLERTRVRLDWSRYEARHRCEAALQIALTREQQHRLVEPEWEEVQVEGAGRQGADTAGPDRSPHSAPLHRG